PLIGWRQALTVQQNQSTLSTQVAQVQRISGIVGAAIVLATGRAAADKVGQLVQGIGYVGRGGGRKLLSSHHGQRRGGELDIGNDARTGNGNRFHVIF